jgi:hypothetical protein
MDVPKYIHVRIGLTDAVYPVRQFITDGLMHDMYEFQVNPTTIGWTHKQWCTPCLADGTSINAAHDDTDTDWRGFLKAHWDVQRNHLSTDSLEEFMTIFRRAAVNYINNKNEQQKEINQSRNQSGGNDARRTDALPHSSGGHGTAAALSGRDTAKVRKTNKPIKPVEPSLFPDF